MMRTFGAAVFLALSASAAWGQTWYGLQENGLEPGYRNQDGYGTCWAFGTMASVETNLIKEGLLPQSTAGLSERDLAWHSGYGGAVDPLNGGGSYMLSSAYFARGDGPLLNSQAPYWSDLSGTGGTLLAGTDPYPNSTTPTAPPRASRPAASYYVRDIEWLHSVSDIKSALLNYGAVSTCWAYNTGTWYGASGHWGASSTYQAASAGAGQPNHSVAIVGWDDNWVTAGGTGAWLIRNSWGGSTQHFGMSYNDFYCGHDSPDTGAQNMGAVSFHNVVPNTFQDIYYHNDLGWTAQQPHAYAFNHFTATQDASLTAVSFYTTDDNVACTVNIYRQFQNGGLGQLAATVTDSLAHEGFHTVDLPTLVSLPQGQDFYIELQTSNGWQANDGSTSVTVVTGGVADPVVTTTARPGESFFSDNGNNWFDLHTVDASANFAIDGLTLAMTGPATTSWNLSSGNWADANGWTAGVPWGGVRAAVNNGGQIIVSQGVAACPELILGLNAGDSGSVHMTSGRLEANWVTVGMGGAGSFTQAGGTHVVRYGLSIARDANSTGTYTLQDGNLVVPRVSIGTGGTLALSGGVLQGDAADANLLTNVVSSGLIEIISGTYWLASIDCPDANVLSGMVQIDAGTTLYVGKIMQADVIGSGTLILDGSLLSRAASPNMAVAGADTSAPVPEPATLSLLALGGLALLRRRG